MKRDNLLKVIIVLVLFSFPLLMRGNKVVYINTNGVTPTFERVTAPDGSLGESITNAVKVPGQIQLFSEDSTLLYDSGPYIADTSGMTIKVRGNTSTKRKHLSYKIKLQQKADLLIRNDSINHQDKNWLLLDAQLFHIVGFYMNELLGMPYAPKFELVDFVLNDSLCGRYLLTESVDRNSDCRIQVDKKEGYIIERDAYWWNEPLSFESSMFYGTYFRWTFKYPDADEVSLEQMTYITNAINDLEAHLSDSTYAEYIDVESFAKWMLGHDILGTYDGWGSNMYFAKFDKSADSKIFMPCMWDFDTMAWTESQNSWVTAHTRSGCSYFPYLFENTCDTTFTATYCALWNAQGLQLISQIEECMLPYATIFPAQYSAYKKWFAERKAFMDEQVNTLHKAPFSAIRNTSKVRRATKQSFDGHLYIVLPDGKKYNLLGQSL